MFRHLTLDLLMAAVTLSAADGFIGTWKADMAKSIFSPGPAPKSRTWTQTQDGDWITGKGENVSADGKTDSGSTRYKRDGKEYPDYNPGIQGTIAYKLIDSRTNEGILKPGAGTSTVPNTLAADGKTFTRTITGTNAKGQTQRNVVVFEKQ